MHWLFSAPAVPDDEGAFDGARFHVIGLLMEEFLGGLAQHAWQFIEKGGIIVGLFFTGFALRADLRSRHADILMRLTENHRALWIYHDEHTGLRRVFQSKVDLTAEPVTAQESRFIQYFINHVIVTFRARKLGLYTSPEQLETDLREFFSYPVPHAAWAKLRRYQDRDFRDYMDRIIQ